MLSRQANLVLYPALISVQHSMDNELGLAESPILFRDLHVEGPVGALMSMTTGFQRKSAAKGLSQEPRKGGIL